MAQPITESVLTPLGLVQLTDITVGDPIVSSSSYLNYVREIEESGPERMYQVTTSDGMSTLCTLDHQWTIQRESSTSEKVMTTEELMLDFPSLGHVIPTMEWGFYERGKHDTSAVSPAIMGELLSVEDPVIGYLTIPTNTHSHAQDIHTEFGRVPLFALSNNADPESIMYTFPEESLEGTSKYYFLKWSGLLSGDVSKFRISEHYFRIPSHLRDKLIMSLIGNTGINLSRQVEREKYLPLLNYDHPGIGNSLKRLVLSSGYTLDGQRRRITSIKDTGREEPVIRFELTSVEPTSYITSGYIVTGG